MVCSVTRVKSYRAVSLPYPLFLMPDSRWPYWSIRVVVHSKSAEFRILYGLHCKNREGGVQGVPLYSECTVLRARFKCSRLTADDFEREEALESQFSPNPPDPFFSYTPSDAFPKRGLCDNISDKLCGDKFHSIK